MPYTYRATTLHKGEKIHEREVTIDNYELYAQGVPLNSLGFRMILDRWNKYSVNSAECGYLHVYTTVTD